MQMVQEDSSVKTLAFLLVEETDTALPFPTPQHEHAWIPEDTTDSLVKRRQTKLRGRGHLRLALR